MVSEVRIYVEGGGNRNDGKRKLRSGMAKLLADIKQAADAKKVKLKIIAGGSRNETHRAFQIAERQTNEDVFNILLVDAEDPVSGTPIEYLQQRDSWDLTEAEEDQVYLMAPTMEAWLAADLEALETYYGQEFNQNAIPRRNNLEETTKNEIEDSLNNATRNTQKGSYRKIAHGTELLGNIDPEKLKKRAPEFKRLWGTLLSKLIELGSD